MPKKPTAAVLLFPGTNCEHETLSALTRNGFAPTLLRWNAVRSLDHFDAVVIPGGFSFEDRGRAGLIASRDPAMQAVVAAAAHGVLVLGICNGAQILVETGLVPGGTRAGESAVALAHNRFGDGSSYFINRWVHIASPLARERTAFTDIDRPLHMPIAHGEGCFMTRDATLLREIVARGQQAFCYTDAAGVITPAANPNGAVLHLAGLTNEAGTVMALMPHPERSPDGDQIFQSMRRWIATHPRQRLSPASAVAVPRTHCIKKPNYGAELFIQLAITDNERLSVEQLLAEQGLPISLLKYRFVGLPAPASVAAVTALLRTGNIANTEKEIVWVRMGTKTYRFDAVRGLLSADFSLPKTHALVTAAGDASRGVVWGLARGSSADFRAALSRHVFHHPASADIVS